MKIFRYTEFKSNPFGHGAEKRTAQISEILKDAGIDFEILNNNDKSIINSSVIFKKSINHILFILHIFNIKYFKSIRTFLRFVYNSIKTEGIFFKKINGGDDLLFWEFTRSNCFYIAGIAREMKIRTVGIPHNIESLVPNQVSAISGTKSPDWFNEEIKYLSYCDLVFCISKEDTSLLNLFGINAFYLPYYPTNEVKNTLLRIRDQRQKKKEAKGFCKILMLGSVDNQPTRLGMIDRMTFFSTLITNEFELLIAGFNTELLIENVNSSDKIKILGTLDFSKLEDLLISIDLILIHQPSTSGALTRIPEMLIAGIPIISNIPSARNYYNINGLYIYEDNDTLLELLRSGVHKMPDLPIKPEKEIKSFIQKFKTLKGC